MEREGKYRTLVNSKGHQQGELGWDAASYGASNGNGMSYELRNTGLHSRMSETQIE